MLKSMYVDSVMRVQRREKCRALNKQSLDFCSRDGNISVGLEG